jgi:hypothetical protein
MHMQGCCPGLRSGGLPLLLRGALSHHAEPWDLLRTFSQQGHVPRAIIYT